MCPITVAEGLRRVSLADRSVGLRVRIPLGQRISVSCERCVLSGRGLCDGPLPCPEEPYRLWYVILCDLETLRMRRSWPTLDCGAADREKEREKELCPKCHWSTAICDGVDGMHVA